MADAWREQTSTSAGIDHPEYRTLLALDIEGYGRAEWTDLTRVRLRRKLAYWCAEVFKALGLAAEQYHLHSTGDGYLISVDPHVPRDILLTSLMRGLRRRLLALNHGKSPSQRLRVRLAVHSGDVLRDPHPIEGRATIVTCRLLDAEALRLCLRATEQPLAVIASEVIYDGIISQGYARLDPSAWHAVSVPTKEGTKLGWVHVPSDPNAPTRSGLWAAANVRHLTTRRALHPPSG